MNELRVAPEASSPGETQRDPANWLTLHEASELLNRELSHRIKNLLSVVGSLATMAGERRPETRAFIAAFQARLNNLAAAHDLLIQAEWGPVMLDGLAERTLASIGIRDRVDLAASGLVVGSHDTQTVAFEKSQHFPMLDSPSEFHKLLLDTLSS